MVSTKTAGGGAAVRSAPPPAPAASKGGSGGGGLPAGVKVEQFPVGNVYTFSVGGKQVQFNVVVQRKAATVEFDVGGRFDRGGLQGREAVRATQIIRRIFEHDVSTRPDGFKYETSAYTGDGYGAKRAAAYEKVGFSKPIGGLGGYQYGFVHNGKMVK